MHNGTSMHVYYYEYWMSIIDVVWGIEVDLFFEGGSGRGNAQEAHGLGEMYERQRTHTHPHARANAHTHTHPHTPTHTHPHTHTHTHTHTQPYPLSHSPSHTPTYT